MYFNTLLDIEQVEIPRKVNCSCKSTYQIVDRPKHVAGHQVIKLHSCNQRVFSGLFHKISYI